MPQPVANGHTSSKIDTNKNDVATVNSNSNTTSMPNGVIKEKHHKRNHVDITASIVPTLNEPKIKKARILEKITYDDLAVEEKHKTIGPAQLNLAKVERYLHGPVPVACANSNNDGDLMNDAKVQDQLRDLDSVQYMIRQDTETWKQRTPHKVLVSPTAAVNALGELSPGGALMRGFQEQSLARKYYFCYLICVYY